MIATVIEYMQDIHDLKIAADCILGLLTAITVMILADSLRKYRGKH